VTGEPLVAVVVPTRNRAAPLATALDSVLAQTYAHLTVWVVDDGSNPPVSLRPCQARDERVHLLRFERTRGAAAARNEGVRAAGGPPLVAFLDDDDAWRTDKLRRQVALAESSPADVAAVETGYDLWEDGRLVLRYVPQAERDLRRLLLERPLLQPSTVLLRREAFVELGGFREDRRRTEDWELWLRLADSYSVAVLPEVHVDRRLNRTYSHEFVDGYRLLLADLEPRLATLPASEARRVRAVHRHWEGRLLALSGEIRAGRRLMWEAWRINRRSWRSLALALALTGGTRGLAAAYRARRVAGPVLRQGPHDPGRLRDPH
jgi:glycosyltransferase involved in cell wall biosynthesis